MSITTKAHYLGRLAAMAAAAIVAVALVATGTTATAAHASGVAVAVAPPPNAGNRGGTRLNSHYPHQPVITPGAPVGAADPAGSTISGTVTNPAKAPRAGFTVAVFAFDQSGTISFERTTTTDASGRYSLGSLPDQVYFVEFYGKPTGAAITWWSDSLTDSVGWNLSTCCGQTYSGTNATVPDAAAVSGAVSCPGCGAPYNPRKVAISLLAFDDETSAWSLLRVATEDSNGLFQFEALPPGQYAVDVTYAGPTNGQEWRLPNYYSKVVGATAGSTVTADVIGPRFVTPMAGGSATESTIYALYWDLLNRIPSDAEVVYWQHAMFGSPFLASNYRAVATGFVNSDEYRLLRIDAAYASILGRAPDRAGEQNWLLNMQQGRITTDDIEKSFYSSDEYLVQHGSTNTAFVASLYVALLSRTGSTAEYEGWAQSAASRGRDWVVDQFWVSAETVQKRVAQMYAQYLGRAPDAGGLASWSAVDVLSGDTATRIGLTSNDEYLNHSFDRFPAEPLGPDGVPPSLN